MVGRSLVLGSQSLKSQPCLLLLSGPYLCTEDPRSESCTSLDDSGC